MENEWIVVSLDRKSYVLILDSSDRFEHLHYTDGEEAHIYVPKHLARPGVYRITKIKVSEGGWSGTDEREWEVPEISGDWTMLATWKHEE